MDSGKTHPTQTHTISWAPEGLLETIITMAQRSLDLQNGIRPRCKPDGTLVTDADTEVEHVLMTFLNTREPQSFVLGEETVGSKDHGYLDRALKGRTWVIDPIDGTLLYCQGMPGWGISLGLMEGGLLTHGLVAFPLSHGAWKGLEVYWSQGDQVVHGMVSMDDNLEAMAREIMGSAKAISPLPRVPGFPGVFAISQRVAKNSIFKGKEPVISTGSCVSAFKYLVHGSIDAYMIRMRLWDVAGFWPLAFRLGARASFSTGRAMDLAVTGNTWNLDVTSPGFLEICDHVIFYNKDKDAMALWAGSDWPGGRPV